MFSFDDIRFINLDSPLSLLISAFPHQRSIKWKYKQCLQQKRFPKQKSDSYIKLLIALYVQQNCRFNTVMS